MQLMCIRNWGPGLFESGYEECLYYELRKEGFYVEKQKIITNKI
ncbi:MAG TPA: GxxExxY protein [Flavobacteriales bacterium]|nr:GxxExxY protein [Flavobacteriales bacterium]